MNNSGDDRLFARLALALFAGGLVGYPPMAAFAPFHFAAAFLVICQALALIFGVAGWRQRTAKVAVGGVLAIVLVSCISFAWFASASQRAERRLRAAMESAKQHAEAEMNGELIESPKVK